MTSSSARCRSGVLLVGSRLLAAKQSTLHAFGMLADAATCVDPLVVTDALFAEQRQAVDGDEPL